MKLTAAGSTLATTYLPGTGNGSQSSLDPATQTTIGTGLAPSGASIDQAGNIFVADNTTGSVFRSVGGGTPTQFATGFNQPAQLAVDGLGNVYVADSGNNRIALATATGVASLLTTFGGTALKAPTGVTADFSGNIYIADTGNQRVLSISPTGTVALKPFTGLSAPSGLTVDAAGNLFVADSGNSRIVELTPAGVQSTVGPATLSRPVGIAVDAAGDLFISDSSNLYVVFVPPASTAPTTLLGNTTGLSSLAVDSAGDIFLAATSRAGVVELNRSSISYAYPDTNVGQMATLAITQTSIGNQSLTLGSSVATGTDTTDFNITASTTNGCSPSEVLTPGQNCGLAAVFQPASRTPQSDTVTFPSNSSNAVRAQLSGVGVQKITTTTAVSFTTTTGGLPLAGQPFKVTATITAAQNVETITGTVMFSVDGGTPQSATINNGLASNTLTVVAGPHTIVASYGGDTNYVGSSSSLMVQAVNPAATNIALSVTGPGTPQNGSSFIVTAAVSSTASQGTITGTVTFAANGTTQVVNVVNGSASATYTFPTGKYPVTATYSGSSYYLTGIGSLTVQVIPSGTSSVKLTLTSPVGGVTYGQTIVLNAATTTAGVNATPTGTVTFTVDGGYAQTFPYASSVSASYPLLMAGNHTLMAAYSGDNSFAPSSGSLTVTIARAQVTGMLVTSPNVSASQNTIQLIATVASSTSIPTGTVMFMAGSNTLGTSAVTAGIATFTTTSNALPSYAFIASYIGDKNFLPASFSTTASATFVLGTNIASVATPQAGVALDFLTVNAFYGYSGTVSFTCSGLPANSVCRPTPVTVAVSADSTQTVQMQIFTNVNTQTAELAPFGKSFGRKGDVASAICLLIGLPFYRRRRDLRFLALALFCLVGTAGLSGCGSDTVNTTTYTTPTGACQVTVSATDGTVTSSTVVSLTVLQGSSQRP